MRYYKNKQTGVVITTTNFEYNTDEIYVEISEEEYHKTIESFIVETSEEEQQDHLRNQRIALLNAFDKWEKAVLRGREIDSEEIMNWYESILDLEESAFVNVPQRINYYL